MATGMSLSEAAALAQLSHLLRILRQPVVTHICLPTLWEECLMCLQIVGRNEPATQMTAFRICQAPLLYPSSQQGSSCPVTCLSDHKQEGEVANKSQCPRPMAKGGNHHACCIAAMRGVRGFSITHLRQGIERRRNTTPTDIPRKNPATTSDGLCLLSTMREPAMAQESPSYSTKSFQRLCKPELSNGAKVASCSSISPLCSLRMAYTQQGHCG